MLALLLTGLLFTRADWPHWVDADADCQDTRQEVLLRDARGPVVQTRCRVVTGHWHDPYDGSDETDPSRLDVDHLVPLKEAWHSGGWRWTRPRRQAYANSLAPGHLVATHARWNRQKGARDPATWVPPDPATHCWYGQTWLRVKAHWGLTIDPDEAEALLRLLARC